MTFFLEPKGEASAISALTEQKEFQRDLLVTGFVGLPVLAPQRTALTGNGTTVLFFVVEFRRAVVKGNTASFDDAAPITDWGTSSFLPINDVSRSIRVFYRVFFTSEKAHKSSNPCQWP